MGNSFLLAKVTEPLNLKVAKAATKENFVFHSE